MHVLHVTDALILSRCLLLQRETLMKELERERMLRMDAEQRLREMTIESDTTKSRLQALQTDFKQ